MKRDTRTAYRARAAATERSIDAALAEVNTDKHAEARRLAAEYAARIRPPQPFTPEELKVARAIRTAVGWHRVIKVNAKSVTVATGYSWNDRYALEKVLEVR